MKLGQNGQRKIKTKVEILFGKREVAQKRNVLGKICQAVTSECIKNKENRRSISVNMKLYTNALRLNVNNLIYPRCGVLKC